MAARPPPDQPAPASRPIPGPSNPTAEARLWAALETGSTESILHAVRVARPEALAALHALVRDVQRHYPHSLDDAHLRLHDLLDDESAAITSDAQQQRRVRDALEKLATTQLHPTVFGRGEGDAESERSVEAAMREARHHLTPKMLGVNPAFADSTAWATSALLLKRLERYRAPADKVALLVNACRLIERRMHVLAQQANAARRERRASKQNALDAAGAPPAADGAGSSAIASAAASCAEDGGSAAAAPHDDDDVPTVVGADEFFPVLLYVLLLAAPPRLSSELSFIGRFRHPTRLRGVSGCYYTHVRAALQFLEMGAPTGWGHASLCPPPADAADDGNVAGDDAQPPESNRLPYFSAAHAIGLYSTGFTPARSYVPTRNPAPPPPPPPATIRTQGDAHDGRDAARPTEASGADDHGGAACSQSMRPSATSAQSWREWREWLFTPAAAAHTDLPAATRAASSQGDVVAGSSVAWQPPDREDSPGAAAGGGVGAQQKVRMGSLFGGLMGGGASSTAEPTANAGVGEETRRPRVAQPEAEVLPPAAGTVSWRGY